MLKKYSQIVLAVFLCFSFNVSSGGLDLKKLLDKVKQNAEKANTNQPQQNPGNGTQPQINQNTPPPAQVNATGSSNQFQSSVTDSIKKKRLIDNAKSSGTPFEVSETADGQINVSKDEVLIDALSKAVRKVHSDLGIPDNHYAKTYNEFQKNITNSAYGVIGKFERIDKENIYSAMGQPDPQKNTWSVTAKVTINTKLTPDNIKKIKDDQRIIYTQYLGNSAEQAREMATMIAVQQYHRIKIIPDGGLAMPQNVFSQNFLKKEYGLIQKVEVIKESPVPYTKFVTSSIKVTLNDMAMLDKKKFSAIQNDIDKSKIIEPPNQAVIQATAVTNEMNSALVIVENALNIKGSSEMVRQDALREKQGVRFGQNGFEWTVNMQEERVSVLDNRMKSNPKINEDVKKEYEKGAKAMVQPAIKNSLLPLSIFTSGFQGITGSEKILELVAINWHAVDIVKNFNSNNGIDNSELDNAKESMADK
jgi:hypothetical protein